jgi:hypothetical protein
MCVPYQAVFGSVEWFDAVLRSRVEAGALRHVLLSIEAYLFESVIFHNFEIGAALLAKTSKSRDSDPPGGGGPASPAPIPDQKYVPFIRSVCIGTPLQNGTGTQLHTAAPDPTDPAEELSELQLDYWTTPLPTDKKKAKEKEGEKQVNFWVVFWVFCPVFHRHFVC